MAIENRRKFARYSAGNAEIRVTCRGEALEGTVVDESIGGICLILAGHFASVLSAGDPIGVQFRDYDGTAYVRSAESDGDRTRIGLSWDPPPAPVANEQAVPSSDHVSSDNDISSFDGATAESFDIVEQVFYQHGNISIVCDVVGISKSGQVKIQVGGDQAFLADGRRLATLSRAERLVDLQCKETLQVLSALYEIESTAEAVLAHEFR